MQTQANTIVDNLAKDGIKVAADKEIIALIAYMQRLGTDIKGKSADEATEDETALQETTTVTP
jgi:cytochrome c oxidase cbb3-type subunit I/II